MAGTVIVGGLFKEFKSLPGVSEASSDQLPATVTLGQGLSAAERRALGDDAGPCDKALVHKRHQRNVMISEPRLTGERHFEAELTLDDDCDEMADHVTGYHLQGTVLAEAARQMVLAVSEAHLLPAAYRYRMRFVTHKTATEYKAYAFPLPLTLHMEVRALREGAGGNFTAEALIRLVQQGTLVAVTTFEFSALSAAFAADDEEDLARAALTEWQS